MLKRFMMRKFVLPFVKKFVMKEIIKRETEVVNLMNKKINLPKLTEKQEERILKSIYGAFKTTVEELLK